MFKNRVRSAEAGTVYPVLDRSLPTMVVSCQNSEIPAIIFCGNITGNIFLKILD